MAEKQNSNDRPYIRERIVKRNNWQGYLAKGGFGLLFAGVLGLTIGIGVAVVAPIVNDAIKPEPELPTIATLHRDEPTETSDHFETTQSPMTDEAESGTVQPMEKPEEQYINSLIEKYMAGETMSAEDMAMLSNAVHGKYQSFYKNLLTVSSINSESAWYEQEERSCVGLIVEISDDQQISLLVSARQIAEAEAMVVTIGQNKLEAKLQGIDQIADLALLKVDGSEVELPILEQLAVATLGNSYQQAQGSLVIGAGEPNGLFGSYDYGNITYIDTYKAAEDSYYQLIYTNMTVVSGMKASGFLFNTDGAVIGFITDGFQSAQTGNQGGVVTAMGISDLKYIIEDLLNSRETAYLGIRGRNVSADVAKEQGTQEGIYITEITMDSPAFLAGLQPGDIITRMGNYEVKDMKELRHRIDELSVNQDVEIIFQRWNRDGYASMNTTIVTGSRTVLNALE